MQKYGLLLVTVLAMSTAGWASPFACVTVPRCVPACEDVTIDVGACLPYKGCELLPDGVDVCVRGNLILVDMYFGCPSCMCGGATCVDEKVVIEDGLCPGMYIVMVRIKCMCSGPCCFMSRTCAMGSTFFQVRCPDLCAPEPTPGPTPGP